MKIRITILDMADPTKPYAILVVGQNVDLLQYPLLNMFTLPATMDARIQHPYALVVERVEDQKPV
jgi:hypothetical protein